jgi:SAM-dependent methyltransferase
MMQELDFISTLHKSTKRDYFERMDLDKPRCMRIAKKFGKEFFDGERKYGYGGYNYINDKRLIPLVKNLVKQYHLTSNSKILDFGCGKGFLMYELNKYLKLKNRCVGVDISKYAKDNAYKVGKEIVHKWPEHTKFDLVVSLGTLHNFILPDLQKVLRYFTRVSNNQFITVDSYRDEQELFNLECWALTCECFFRPEEWRFLFNKLGYIGDYSFLFYE